MRASAYRSPTVEMLASAILSDRYIVMSAARVRVLILIPTAAAGLVHAAETPQPATTTPVVVITGKILRGLSREVGGLDRPARHDAAARHAVFSDRLPARSSRTRRPINFKDVSKYLPLVAYQEQQGPDILRPQTRGMQGGNFQNSQLDGMTMFVTVANAHGAVPADRSASTASPASLYGPANPSGMFNFVSKRPTGRTAARSGRLVQQRQHRHRARDFGGKLDENGVFSYRLNGALRRRRRLSSDGVTSAACWATSASTFARGPRRARAELQRLPPGQQGLSGLVHLRGGHRPAGRRRIRARRATGRPTPASTCETRTRHRASQARFQRELASRRRRCCNQDATRDINTPVNNLTNNTGTYTCVVRQRLCAALRDHQRHGLSQRHISPPGLSITTSRSAPPATSAKTLCRDHCGNRGERATRHCEHR